MIGRPPAVAQGADPSMLLGSEVGSVAEGSPTLGGANPPTPGLAAGLRLILPDPTAIGVGLSHASRTPPNEGAWRTAQ